MGSELTNRLPTVNPAVSRPEAAKVRLHPVFYIAYSALNLVALQDLANSAEVHGLR